MDDRFHLLLALIVFLIAIPLSAQVATNTGTVYGKVLDEKAAPLPGVNVQLESDVIQAQSATTGASGAFRFANLPPGTYSALFTFEGFTKLHHQNIQVSVGSQVQLRATLKPSLAEELTVISETPLLDARKTGSFEIYNREYMQHVPTARDPWSLIDQTPGMDTNRNQWTQQGVQAAFVTKGGGHGAVWSYDGINYTDPIGIGNTGSYYDFDAFEEIQIVTTGGVSVNMVTKRGGNRWAGNASYYISNDSLQSSNTPDELIALGLEDKSNRLDEISEYGFDLGGPIIKDKLSVWGAYHKNEIKLFAISNEPIHTKLEMFNFKTNFNWNSDHETMFGYFAGYKSQFGRGFNYFIQAPETLWDQGNSDTLLPGLWSGQHTWIPNDHMILTARYGYLGLGFQLVPRGGKDKPMIFLASIPRLEDNSFVVDPIDRPTHDISFDLNYFKENLIRGDHEFKFGFTYRTVDARTFSSYGNGILMVDFYQTVPHGPLTSGYLKAQHSLDVRTSSKNFALSVGDTYRHERLTLQLGLAFNRSTGKNLPANIPAVRGFESAVGPFEYPGGDPGITFSNVSPQVGATYDLSGDGKTLIRGQWGRYYGAYDVLYSVHSNPTAVYNGAIFSYINANEDRTITPDELIGDPSYYGGLSSGIFDLNAFLAKRLYDDDLKPPRTDQLVVGFERELLRNLSVAVTYTHSRFNNLVEIVPFGVSSDDYLPAGTYNINTELGDFSVPVFELPFRHDGTAILTNINDYKRTYNGVDIVIHKRMSDNFMFNGSLVLQRQKAKYTGGDSLGHRPTGVGTPDFAAIFPFDPSIQPFLNDQPYAGFGSLYSEWQFKLNGVYLLPLNISVGASLKYRQGFPFVLLGTIDDPDLEAFTDTRRRLLLVERYGSRRNENIFSMDLQFDKRLDAGRYGSLTLSATVFNVTNENTVISRNNSLNTLTFNAVQEHLAPRSIRLGVRYSF